MVQQTVKGFLKECSRSNKVFHFEQDMGTGYPLILIDGADRDFAKSKLHEITESLFGGKPE